MGGLASALALAKEGFTSIDVYEYASDLGFVGAGIHLAPNMARVLDRLGVWEEIKSDAVEAQATSIRGSFSATWKDNYILTLIFLKKRAQLMVNWPMLTWVTSSLLMRIPI